jgi:hypothetical protein
MSQLLNRSDYESSDFELGDIVEFDSPYGGGRLRGEVVRVYNSRNVYHVEVDGERYSVRTDSGNQDNVRRVR